MTFSPEWLVVVAAIVVIGVTLWRVTGVLRSVVESSGRSTERNAILQDRFLERMYEKIHANDRNQAVQLANLHAKESGQAMRDELVRDSQGDKRLALEAAKVRRERERPRMNETHEMDMGV